MPTPTPGEHYFSAEPSVASDRRTVRLVLPDVTADLVTDRGVFSADAVDAGTRLLLLEAPHPPATGNLLDLGCGYGPIARVLAERSPGATVWAVDVNERARALAAENTAGVGDVRVVAPDGVPPEVRFDGIWSNPPIKVGKAALHELLGRWIPRLAPGAAAWFVVHKHLGSDSLARWLAEQGWPTTRLQSRGGYRILEVRT